MDCNCPSTSFSLFHQSSKYFSLPMPPPQMVLSLACLEKNPDYRKTGPYVYKLCRLPLRKVLLGSNLKFLKLALWPFINSPEKFPYLCLSIITASTFPLEPSSSRPDWSGKLCRVLTQRKGSSSRLRTVIYTLLLHQWQTRRISPIWSFLQMLTVLSYSPVKCEKQICSGKS